jgi:hypothetical protein
MGAHPGKGLSLFGVILDVYLWHSEFIFLTEFPKGEMTSYLATLANWVFRTAAAACEGGIIFNGYE